MGQEEWVTGKVGLRINDIPVEFEMTVPSAPVKPQRMLPIFQMMANSFVEIGVEAAAAAGKAVSCKAGCGACCRQPVPISEVEVYRIAELIEAMEEPRRSEVRQRFKDAAAHFHGIGWYERFEDHQRAAPTLAFEKGYPEGMKLVMEYFNEGVACPFLEAESCSIHQDRPLACREYLVTSPAENCSAPSATNIGKVELPAKPTRGLNALVADAGGKFAYFPVLSRALELAENSCEDFSTKSGPEWVKVFLLPMIDSEKAAERE